jgi:hypothetical protein
MTKTIILATSIFALILTGCGRSPESAEEVKFNPYNVKIMQPVAGQRFTPTTSALVSYDTWTGQLCKTYGWGRQSAPSMDDCSALANYVPPRGN